MEDSFSKANEEKAGEAAGQVAALNVKITGLEGEVSAKNSEIAAKKQELVALKQSTDSDRKSADAEKKKLEASIDDLNSEKQRMQMEIVQLRSEIEQLKKVVENANVQIAQIDTYVMRAESAERQISTYEARNGQLEDMFAEEQALRRKYHNQIQELKGAIRVYARVRPMIQKENLAKETLCLKKVDDYTLDLEREGRKEGKTFVYDSIFDASTSQASVFAECKDLVQSAVDGYNVTIFAYGQTGAGKTHTMYGGDTEESQGLVPRVIEELFRIKTKDHGRYTIGTKVYMMELYRDDLQDLLLPRGRKSPGSLEVKRDARGSVYVENVHEVSVETADELHHQLDFGMEKRHVAATKMNADSSRSHLITTIVLSVYNRSKKTTTGSKITLVDLAGSERLKKSEATGEQMKEAMSINKSLTALGDVIEALTSKSKHIPYRNHKLTELMSDSLGGNAKTLMFANCSPALSNAEESMGTLQYAARAKLITNQVAKQTESKETNRLKQVIATMAKEMEALRGGGGGGAAQQPLPSFS